MQTVEEQIVAARWGNRSEMVNEYMNIIRRNGEQREGDAERLGELQQRLGYTDETVAAHCRLGREYAKTKPVAEDYAPIRAAEEKIPECDREARQVFNAAVKRLLPHVEIELMGNVLAAITNAIPRDRSDPAASLIGLLTPIAPANDTPDESPEEIRRRLENMAANTERLVEATAALTQVENLVKGSRAELRAAEGRKSDAQTSLMQIRMKAPWLETA